jgi:hypothetical protein
MRIVSQQSDKREVFAWGEGDEWFLSPFPQVQNTRRPINRYNSREELLTAANAKHCRVTWQDN